MKFGVVLRVDGRAFEPLFSGASVETFGPLRITGHVRLDARDALKARLSIDAEPLSDLALCLRAYEKWGDSFIHHLAGDFGFALWDGQRRCLIAARDRLGIYPLFHATAGGAVYVSDSVDWIASHADVSRELDEVWIGDFLTIGMSLDFDRSVWRHIPRLAPAHRLKVWADGCQDIGRYWELEIGDPIHFADRRRYTEHFIELVEMAVKDRLPLEGRVGISMSGGLDSTTLAACTLAAVGDPSRIVAECHHYASLVPDDEDRFATLVARKLGIELHLRVVDDLLYDPLWRTRGVQTEEPSVAIVQAHWGEQLSRLAGSEAGIWFYGEGPDNALTFDRDPYFSWLRRRGDWRGMARAAIEYARVKGLSGWRKTLRRRFAPESPPSPLVFAAPPWLNRDFERRLHLDERVRDLGRPDMSAHPWHPRAVASFKDPIWPSLFDDLRQGEAAGPFEWRHPFLDLRVLEYMIALPPVPWSWRKHLVREAMRGRLPDEILHRDKTPLRGSPQRTAIGPHGFPPLSGSFRLEPYLDGAAVPLRVDPAENLDSVIAAHALDYWLIRG